MARSDYEIKPIKARHFTSPLCTETDHRCYPQLLRQVADWMDKHAMEDPEIEDLVFKTQFTGDDADTYYEAATLYYREKEF